MPRGLSLLSLALPGKTQAGGRHLLSPCASWAQGLPKVAIPPASKQGWQTLPRPLRDIYGPSRPPGAGRAGLIALADAPVRLTPTRNPLRASGSCWPHPAHQPSVRRQASWRGLHKPFLYIPHRITRLSLSPSLPNSPLPLCPGAPLPGPKALAPWPASCCPQSQALRWLRCHSLRAGTFCSSSQCPQGQSLRRGLVFEK